MSEEELIKYFKNLTAVTKDSNVKMKELETGVEISVEMAEQLISIIEKLQKDVKGLMEDYQDLGKELCFNFVHKEEIREKIKEISNKIKNPSKDTYSYEIIEYTAQVEVLQELLEEDI